MSDSFNDFARDLADEPLPDAVPTSRERTYPCGQCAGTGIYQGVRTRQTASQCFACKGSGHFKTDPRKLADNRRKAAASRDSKREAAREQHRTIDGGELLAFVVDTSRWSTYADSLLAQHNNGKAWSPRQVDTLRAMRAKREAKAAATAAVQAENATQVDLSAVRAMFEAALESGHSKPVYRAEGVVISRAPNTGRNPGALYVKSIDTDAYGGKVLGVDFAPSREGCAQDFAGARTAAEALLAIAADPLEAAVRYGRKTGRCACCNRKLTNKLSVELGIGPICRDGWGL